MSNFNDQFNFYLLLKVSSFGRNPNSWLLRLFESKLFDVVIAMQYLSSSKEPGVLHYLGKFLYLAFSLWSLLVGVCHVAS